MLSNVLARIKSAPKAAKIAALGLAAILLAALIILWPAGQRQLVANGKTYALELADSESEREQGLSGRSSLPLDTGMLFVFDQPGRQCFWMKDMRFNLDIIWLDANRKVAHIERNVSPSSYPDSFCPDKSAQYVLELNAGQADQAGIKQGSILHF